MLFLLLAFVKKILKKKTFFSLRLLMEMRICWKAKTNSIRIAWNLNELLCGPILNYDIDHYEINHDYNNNYNNDNKTSEIEAKRQRNIFEVLALYFQR